MVRADRVLGRKSSKRGPMWGATKIAISNVQAAVDPSSTLELAVRKWPIPDDRQTGSYPFGNDSSSCCRSGARQSQPWLLHGRIGVPRLLRFRSSLLYFPVKSLPSSLLSRLEA
jgi:hypothetical protein